MFSTSTQERINELMEEKSVREHKIRLLIKGVDAQINDLNKIMSTLTDNYVTQEIEGNVEALAAIDKEITDTRLNIENLQGKKDAYGRLDKEEKYIKDAIPKILESARKDMNERTEKVNKKNEEKKALELKIKEIENKIKSVDAELFILHSNDVVSLIKPLLKYIEPRKIKNGFEEQYLRVLLSDGPSSEYLDQYIDNSIYKGYGV